MKRSAELERRTPLRAKTSIKRGKPIARTAKRRKPKRSPNEFPDEAKAEMRRRSGGRCEANTAVCEQTAVIFHHRKSRASKDQRPVNGLHICNPCHLHIHGTDGHGSITKSRIMGWIVASWDDPARVPVRRGDGGR